jgi:hypothetical protein
MLFFLSDALSNDYLGFVCLCVQEHKLKMDDTFKSHHEAIDKLNHEIFLLQVHFSHVNSFPLALLPDVPSLSLVLGVQCQRV